jgi:hypothetical protein
MTCLAPYRQLTALRPEADGPVAGGGGHLAAQHPAQVGRVLPLVGDSSLNVLPSCALLAVSAMRYSLTLRRPGARRSAAQYQRHLQSSPASPEHASRSLFMIFRRSLIRGTVSSNSFVAASPLSIGIPSAGV